MRNFLLRYSSLFIFLFLVGLGRTHASNSEPIRRFINLSQVISSCSSENEKNLIKVAPIEVREEEEDKHDATIFSKYTECSKYFSNALPQGDFFSLEESRPVGHDLSLTSPDQYLLLRVFRI